jgi:hypothetical protein
VIVLKWDVLVDDMPHPIGRGSVVLVACQHSPDVVTVWTEEPSLSYMADRMVRVFGTGQRIPEEYTRHLGSTMAANGILVWHVYERAK